MCDLCARVSTKHCRYTGVPFSNSDTPGSMFGALIRVQRQEEKNTSSLDLNSISVPSVLHDLVKSLDPLKIQSLHLLH